MKPQNIILRSSNFAFSTVLKALFRFTELQLATLSLVWICLLYIVEDFFVIHHRLMAFSQIRNLDILFFLYTWYYVGHISRIIIFGWHTYGQKKAGGCTISAYRTDPCLYHVPEAKSRNGLHTSSTFFLKSYICNGSCGCGCSLKADFLFVYKSS